MKFGRTIKASLYSEWSSKYIRYSELKKEIKNRLAKNNGVWSDKDEDDFVEILRQELDKVYDFQKQKVRERRRSDAAFAVYHQRQGGLTRFVFSAGPRAH